MQHSVRTISSSDAKANLGDVLSSLQTHGPIEITRNGKTVGLLTPPPMQIVDRSRIAALAIAYSKGLISWPQIAEETGASYGDVLVELGLKNLHIPKVTPKNRPEQMALFHHILDLAAAHSKRETEG
jgi:prevent-host-death family protein